MKRRKISGYLKESMVKDVQSKQKNKVNGDWRRAELAKPIIMTVLQQRR